MASTLRRYRRIPGPRADIGEVVPGLHQLSLRTTSVFVAAMADQTGDAIDAVDREPSAGGSVALIDAGWRINAGRILEYLGAIGHSAGAVRRLLATHYHHDHIGGMARIQMATGLPVEAHHSEADRLKQERRGDIPNPAQQWWLKPLLWPFMAALRPPPIPATLPLHEGDTLPLLGGARVIHTPGHTPGSISLYFPENGILIAGDAMQRRGDRLIPPSPFFSSDMPAARESIRKLAGLDFEILCLSHFAPMRKGARSAARALAEYVT